MHFWSGEAVLVSLPSRWRPSSNRLPTIKLQRRRKSKRWSQENMENQTGGRIWRCLCWMRRSMINDSSDRVRATEVCSRVIKWLNWMFLVEPLTLVVDGGIWPVLKEVDRKFGVSLLHWITWYLKHMIWHVRLVSCERSSQNTVFLCHTNNNVLIQFWLGFLCLFLRKRFHVLLSCLY